MGKWYSWSRGRSRSRRFVLLTLAASLIASVVVGAVAASGSAAGIRARIEPWTPVAYQHQTPHAVPAKKSAGPSDADKAASAGAYAKSHDKSATGAKGAQLPATQLHASAAKAAPAVSGDGSNNKVLILDSTVTGGASSIEAQEAASQGYGVDIVDAATWSSMTAAQFAAYRAIVLGDPTCSDESSVAAAEANATTWGPVIDGNIEIIGSDPVFHATYTNPAIAAVTQRAVDFAAAQSGKTGAYISLSCYFAGTSAPTHVTLLDGLDVGGSGFAVQGAGCSDSIHIEAASPALSGVDDTLLSNWNCSVHEFFTAWPAKFGVLAVDTTAGSLYTGQDGTTGNPYILAFPGGSFLGRTENAGGGTNDGHSNACNHTANPVNCATGEFWHTFSDLAVPGRGPSLDLERTYSSSEAATDSPFGFGWNSSYTMSLAVDPGSGAVQITEENGATTVFTPSSGGYAAPPRVFATLTKNADGTWTFVRHQQERFAFNASGRLTAISDLNGYTTALSYNAAGQLTTISDPENRLLTVAYGANGKIASVTDPVGRSVQYRYDTTGNLTGVTDVAGGTWAFAYDGNHLMTSMTDPRAGTVSNLYDATGRVTSQTDAAARTTTFAYSDSGTTITDPDGAVTVQNYTQGQLVSVTKGAGTSSAATWQYAYDPATLGLTSSADPDGHTTTYAYAGGSYQPTTVTDPLGRVTTMTYNTFEEPLTVTDPNGTASTYSYDGSGNPLSIARPLAGTTSVQTTSYAYADTAHPGDVTASTDPDGKTSQYTYDAFGDVGSSIDPLGNKTTYAYDGIGRRTGMVSPRGNTTGADPTKFTTAYAYDAFGDLTSTTDPLGHTTSSTYDPNRNRTTVTDAAGNVTSYAFDADNELVTTTRADGTKLTTGYDTNGNQINQTDAVGHTTAYAYDALNRAVSVTDPLGRLTSYGYDGAGNLTRTQDPSGRTTTYGFDAANELTAVTYSDGTTPNVAYTYTPDGQRASMTDGTGTTSYTYDSLNRLTATTNGAGQSVGYAYDLKGSVTGLTYPNGKSVARTYDNAGRLSSVTDWLGNASHFTYDASGNLTGISYPNTVQATSSYDNADQLGSITDQHGSTTLANYAYTRDNLGQITAATTTGAAAGTQTYSYTQLNQLGAIGSTPYSYDSADNPTKLANGTTQSFDAANELTASTSAATAAGTVATDQVVSHNQGSTSTKIVSPALTTTAGNELILAFVGADGPVGNDQAITGVTGGGLHWTLASRANGSYGTAEVWQAYSTAVLTNIKVTASLKDTPFDGSITVATFTGANAAVGATATGSAFTGQPTVTVKTTTAGSQIWAAGHDWLLNKPRTPIAGQTLVNQFLDKNVHDTYWVQKTAAIPTVGTSVAVGDTAPTNDYWELAAVEVTPATTGTTSATTNYSYDKQGNRTSAIPAGGVGTAMTYDQAARLTAYGTAATYSYDGDSLRMAKTVSGATTGFAWDQSGSIPLLLADGSSNYIYGPTGQAIEQITGGTITYLSADQQGSTRLLTDTTGAVVGAYTYDPYGNVTSHTGSATANLQYDGQYTDAESGYQYLRARYYDPATAQFVSSDPLSGLTRSTYQYVANDPLNRADPSGQFMHIVFGAVVGAIVGGTVGAANYFVNNMIVEGQPFNARKFLGSTVGGAVNGAIVGGCAVATDGLAMTACSAAGGAAGELTNELISGDHLDGVKIGFSAFAGAVGDRLIPESPLIGRRPFKFSSLLSRGANTLREYKNALTSAGILTPFVDLFNDLRDAAMADCG